MKTSEEVLELAKRKLIGAGRSLEWFEAQMRCRLSPKVFPSDAALAVLAYFGDTMIATLHPEKFDTGQDSINARNFASAVVGSRLSLSQAEQVWTEVFGNTFHRGTIPMKVFHDAIGNLGEKGPLL